MSNTRKYLIAGNWKMNKTSSEALSLLEEIHAAAGTQTEVDAAVCPPFTALAAAGSFLSENNSGIRLGAQNLYPEPSGAYTGEVSPEMLKDLFCEFVILGHSERRQYFKESDAFINKKVTIALAHNLKPVLCVGETLAEREAGQTLPVIERQVKDCLNELTAEQAEQVVIAYEPVWAIGTGKTATPEMAQEAHAAIRKLLAERFQDTIAVKMRILYGGSMKPKNAGELLGQPDVDGGLIGGASLDAKSFVELIQAARAQL